MEVDKWWRCARTFFLVCSSVAFFAAVIHGIVNLLLRWGGGNDWVVGCRTASDLLCRCPDEDEDERDSYCRRPAINVAVKDARCITSDRHTRNYQT